MLSDTALGGALLPGHGTRSLLPHLPISGAHLGIRIRCLVHHARCRHLLRLPLQQLLLTTCRLTDCLNLLIASLHRPSRHLLNLLLAIVLLRTVRSLVP